MLTNEQRAHDLAVAILPQFVEINHLSNRSAGDTIEVDYFEEYLNMYDAFLTALHKKFPGRDK